MLKVRMDECGIVTTFSCSGNGEEMAENVLDLISMVGNKMRGSGQYATFAAFIDREIDNAVAGKRNVIALCKKEEA